MISQYQKYLTFGKYTKNCPKYLIAKAREITCQKVNKKYIENVLRVIKDEFDPQKHTVTKTNDFKKSRFISVKQILKKRQTSCGSVATVVAAVFRNLGIPTKLINGYFVKFNPEMRHAWNEIYVQSLKKFVPFDITRKDFKISKDHIKKDEWIDWSDLERDYKPPSE